MLHQSVFTKVCVKIKLSGTSQSIRILKAVSEKESEAVVTLSYIVFEKMYSLFYVDL